MKAIRVGSRDSALAVAQAKIVMDAITNRNPTIIPQLVTMKTMGDKLLDRPLESMGGKEVFVKELEQALLEDKVDICVHSLKDMAVSQNPRLPLVAVGMREDSRDVLILPPGAEEMDPEKPIGCSSLRRKTQLAILYPGVKTAPVRGNVLTRLEKLDRGEYGALVLAAAGLKRLGLQNRIHTYFPVDRMVPACCQGILAVQGRAGEDTAYLGGFHHPDTWDVMLAERAFLEVLGGGCTSPVAAYATIEGDILTIRGYTVDSRGRMRPGEVSGSRRDPGLLGRKLVESLKVEAGSV